MKILVLGGDGMLGHQLLKQLRERHEVRVTLRQDPAAYASIGLFTPKNAYTGVDLRTQERLAGVLADFRPQAIVNAAGIIKQRADGMDVLPILEINALLPHRLALLCKPTGTRLIQISTDCVFSGTRGRYREEDSTDPDDLYGRSKLLGEVTHPGAVTLRTSIIGGSLYRNASLVDWFLQQRGRIKGYRNAIFSGFTTIELARVIELVLVRHTGASGLYHVSSNPISKYDLLVGLRDKLGRALEIVPDDAVRIDRSLDSTRFRAEFGYTPPAWDRMLEELADDLRSGTALAA